MRNFGSGLSFSQPFVSIVICSFFLFDSGIVLVITKIILHTLWKEKVTYVVDLNFLSKGNYLASA